MAITTAMCTSFKGELLSATHDFDASGGNSFKLALYASTATLGATTTAYTTTGEVSASGSYSLGGGALTNINPATSGTTGYTDFADISFTTATITARGALIYNDTNGDKAVCALDFGGNKTSTAGTFTIAFPAAAASTAIIRIA
jgi:hypothetical protein